LLLSFAVDAAARTSLDRTAPAPARAAGAHGSLRDAAAPESGASGGGAGDGWRDNLQQLQQQAQQPELAGVAALEHTKAAQRSTVM
jgi:hypothetical protein